jgi:ABC-type polar amino acid transport system ATPase subunit
MPKFLHKVESNYVPSFRADNVVSMFNVPVEKKLCREWEVDLPIEDVDWTIGMIVGPSGSGKTTIAREAFKDARFFDGLTHDNWDNTKSLLESFSEEISTKEVVGALSQVGFSSPPNWLLPFDKLSNGQKFRAEMARLVLETSENQTLVVDEFTSVVDRGVAKICAASIQKMIRKKNRKMIAVSCHIDIAEWLEPDWIYFADTGKFQRGGLRRPPIQLTLQRIYYSTPLWSIFKGHHYLDGNVNHCSRSFVATLDGVPVAYVAAIPFPHPHISNMWRGHRTVVLPDYQGIGIGNRLSDEMGQYFIDQGKRYTSVTSHPAMIHHRMNSDLWIMTRKPGRVPANGKSGSMATAASRVTASFEYIGTGYQKNDNGTFTVKFKDEIREAE